MDLCDFNNMDSSILVFLSFVFLNYCIFVMLKFCIFFSFFPSLKCMWSTDRSDRTAASTACLTTICMFFVCTFVFGIVCIFVFFDFWYFLTQMRAEH